MKRIIISAFLLGAFLFSSCKKYLDIEPVGRIIPEKAEDYRNLLTSAYSVFPRHKALLALRTDEVVLNEFSDDMIYNRDIYTWNDAGADPATTPIPYQTFYQTIFYANNIIAEAEIKAGKSADVEQIVGEAYLLRAYCHFELLNLFAKPYNAATASTDRGVPVSTETDLEQNYKPSSVAAVYEQVLKDISAGEALLTVTDYEAGKNYRFTKRAALALKTRVFLYRAEWSKALEAAQQALQINSRLEDLNVSGSRVPNSYLSAENIMSLENTLVSSVAKAIYIAPAFVNRYTENKDLRRAKYFSRSGSRYNPLKTGSDDLKITFRNAELFLTEAEAAYHTGNESLAKESLLALKVKRLTPDYYATESTRVNGLTGAALLTEILNERARELALEGHRWYDLRRTEQPELIHTYDGESIKLQKNDPRYTLRFPASAIAVNPDLR